jgi:hypothetical protein
MKQSHLTGYICTCVILLAALVFKPVSVEAAVIDSNGTLTIYDAVSGNLTFDYDQTSPYEITGTEVILNTNDIYTTFGMGAMYQFVIPNFYDPLPMKTLEITMQGAYEGASRFDLPGVFEIIGADSDYFNGGPAQPVFGSFVSGTLSPTLVTEYWEMFPNPDYEIVKLFVPVEFELQSISIATQSSVVPIPASIWLFGSGLLGLAGIARRKMAA